MNSSLYEEVNKKFNQLKEKKQNEYADRVNKVYMEIPEIKEIDNSVNAHVFEMFTKAARGENCDEVVEEFSNKLRQLKEKKNELLVENGFGPDYLNEIYNCKKCKDTGLYKDKQCECYKKIVTETLLKYSNISAQMKNQTFSKFDINLYSDKANEEGIIPKKTMTGLLSKCKKFAKNLPKNGGNMIFYGGPGLGKTFMSSAIANEVIKYGTTVIYQTAGEIFAAIEDVRFGRGSEVQKRVYSQIYDVDLLIIDDLGTEYRNQISDAEFFRFLNARILNEKSTIISTNLSLEQLRKDYSERIFSRIIGSFEIFKFYGEDVRYRNF